MARIIFISPYMKGGRDSARLAHRTRYFATREGVQLLKDDNAHLPVTKKQQQYIQRLLRSFPEARELPEYENYANTPNRKTAFAFIEQIHEDFIEPMDGRENYLDYVANRPGVKALGEHGLWDAHGKVPSLENAVAEVARHTGNVWTPIISLSRENAERLGYTDLKNWQELINASITDIAKGYKIHPDRLRWYAAMHEKEKHIHVHMVLFSTDPKEGYLSRQGIRSIKSALVSTIYRNDRLHIYEQKDEQRGLLRQEAEARMATLIEQMATGTLQSDKLELLVTDLAQRLREVSGKKVYGYLPSRVKRIVDEIVDELAKDERVSSAYALWQDLREQLCIDYNQTPPQRVPLSQQKEFKTVRNMVIRETLRLSEMHFTFEDDAMQDEPEPEEPPVPPDPSAERMIHQQARFYRRAKSMLDATDADPSEKSMALVTLHRLWEEGYTIAAHQLGKSYRDGVGSSVDQELAAEWFQKSAEAGNPCSAYALGKLLLEQEQLKTQRLLEELRTVKSSNATEIRRLKKELATLRKILVGYVNQIDSLDRINKRQQQVIADVTQKYNTASQQISTLSKEKENLDKKVTLAAQLDVTNIRIEPRNKRGKVAKKVKDIVKLAISFTIVKNITAENGERTIYIRITKPDNDALTKSASNTFSYENRTLTYSCLLYTSPSPRDS